MIAKEDAESLLSLSVSKLKHWHEQKTSQSLHRTVLVNTVFKKIIGSVNDPDVPMKIPNDEDCAKSMPSPPLNKSLAETPVVHTEGKPGSHAVCVAGDDPHGTSLSALGGKRRAEFSEIQDRGTKRYRSASKDDYIEVDSAVWRNPKTFADDDEEMEGHESLGIPEQENDEKYTDENTPMDTIQVSTLTTNFGESFGELGQGQVELVIRDMPNIFGSRRVKSLPDLRANESSGHSCSQSSFSTTCVLIRV